jgi:UDP-N-acetylglucosamine--N-acetylmuramyl-(pentapeptide) pyrophosphoryl-undecaprenol N-acetylglucosamine transferase
MKIIIVGGHLSPALAVIERLPKSAQVLFIGRKYALEGDKAFSLEYQKITSLGIPFVSLVTGRLQRKITRFTFSSLFKLPIGFMQAFKALASYKADCVVCFGGYVQIPVAFAAYLLGIPIVTHEQTRRAGLANKIIAPFTRTICISWPESVKYFSANKTILTGIPLRKEFFQSPHLVKYNKQRIIYITGGSLGAHAINLLVEGCIEKLLEKFHVVHQTGAATEYNDYERLEKIRRKVLVPMQDRYKLSRFIDPQEAAQTMAAADLVVSRSGMNTTAELMYLEKPCLLIPLPHGQTNEQLENAVFLQKLGLAKVLRQDGLTPEMLYSQIATIIDKLDVVRSSASKTKKLINYDAAEKIVEIIQQACKQKVHQKK